MSGRILVLGSYPITHPIHGGQIRLQQIVRAYRENGFDVRVATYYGPSDLYTRWPAGPCDNPLPLQSLQNWQGHAAPFIEDLCSGPLVAADDALIERLERHAQGCRIVHLEQPWLLPVYRCLVDRGRMGPLRLVYGSQNIEYRLKQSIFSQYSMTGVAPLVQAIESLERDCAQHADLCVAVTPADALDLRSWSGAAAVLAPNGIEPWRSAAAHRAHWQARLGGAPFALYVASGHPPNLAGFCDSMGECLSALAPDQRIVLAGSVSELIIGSDWFKRWAAVNSRRVVPVGVLSDEDLSALRDLAHTFILPMTSGEGSNLKTAEALYSGKAVVATPRAMRGFERFVDLARVKVREPGVGFTAAIRQSLLEPVPYRDDQDRTRCEDLTWTHTLRALCERIQALA